MTKTATAAPTATAPSSPIMRARLALATTRKSSIAKNISAEYSDYKLKLEVLSATLGRILKHVRSIDANWVSLVQSQCKFADDVYDAYPHTDALRERLAAAKTSVHNVADDIGSPKSPTHPTVAEASRIEAYLNDVDAVLEECPAVERAYLETAHYDAKADRLSRKGKANEQVTRNLEKLSTARIKYQESVDNLVGRMKAVYGKYPAVFSNAHGSFWHAQGGASTVVAQNACAVAAAAPQPVVHAASPPVADEVTPVTSQQPPVTTILDEDKVEKVTKPAATTPTPVAAAKSEKKPGLFEFSKKKKTTEPPLEPAADSAVRSVEQPVGTESSTTPSKPSTKSTEETTHHTTDKKKGLRGLPSFKKKESEPKEDVVLSEPVASEGPDAATQAKRDVEEAVAGKDGDGAKHLTAPAAGEAADTTAEKRKSFFAFSSLKKPSSPKEAESTGTAGPAVAAGAAAAAATVAAVATADSDGKGDESVSKSAKDEGVGPEATEVAPEGSGTSMEKKRSLFGFTHLRKPSGHHDVDAAPRAEEEVQVSEGVAETPEHAEHAEAAAATTPEKKRLFPLGKKLPQGSKGPAAGTDSEVKEKESATAPEVEDGAKAGSDNVVAAPSEKVQGEPAAQPSAEPAVEHKPRALGNLFGFMKAKDDAKSPKPVDVSSAARDADSAAATRAKHDVEAAAVTGRNETTEVKDTSDIAKPDADVAVSAAKGKEAVDVVSAPRDDFAKVEEAEKSVERSSSKDIKESAVAIDEGSSDKAIPVVAGSSDVKRDEKSPSDAKAAAASSRSSATSPDVQTADLKSSEASASPAKAAAPTETTAGYAVAKVRNLLGIGTKAKESAVSSEDAADSAAAVEEHVAPASADVTDGDAHKTEKKNPMFRLLPKKAATARKEGTGEAGAAEVGEAATGAEVGEAAAIPVTHVEAIPTEAADPKPEHERKKALFRLGSRKAEAEDDVDESPRSADRKGIFSFVSKKKNDSGSAAKEEVQTEPEVKSGPQYWVDPKPKSENDVVDKAPAAAAAAEASPAQEPAAAEAVQSKGGSSK